MNIKNNKKYIFIQIVLSFIILALMPIYSIFDESVVKKVLVIENEIPFPFDPVLDQIYVNQQVIYWVFVWFVPMTIAMALSFYMVLVLKIRKKTRDFSNLSKFVKIILMNIGENTFKEFIFSPALPAQATLGYSVPEANGIYETIQIVFGTVSILLHIFLFWPWLSFLGFLRRKKIETAAKKV